MGVKLNGIGFDTFGWGIWRLCLFGCANSIQCLNGSRHRGGLLCERLELCYETGQKTASAFI